MKNKNLRKIFGFGLAGLVGCAENKIMRDDYFFLHLKSDQLYVNVNKSDISMVTVIIPSGEIKRVPWERDDFDSMPVEASVGSLSGEGTYKLIVRDGRGNVDIKKYNFNGSSLIEMESDEQTPWYTPAL